MNNKIKVKLTDKIVFGDGNIYIQTMANIPYAEFEKLRKQVKFLKKLPVQICRLSLRNKDELSFFLKIKNEFESDDFVFVADTHFDPEISKAAIKSGVKKIRINPGNMNLNKLKELIKLAKDYNSVIRIGINGGSCKEKLGDNFNEYDVINLLYDYITTFEKENFYSIILSAKFSDHNFSLNVNKLISEKFKYPIHLGVTEAGDIVQSTIKHTIFYNSLLPLGIGDTIRVSITDDPAKEVEVANYILKVLGLKKGIEVISCPTCGRTWGNLVNIVKRFNRKVLLLEKKYNFNRNIKIALMGCEVNGPGEAKDADIGLSLMKNGGLIFKKGIIFKKLESKKMFENFIFEVEDFIKNEKKNTFIWK